MDQGTAREVHRRCAGSAGRSNPLFHLSSNPMSPPLPNDAHFDEQFPLSAMDDFMVHQTPDPVRVVWSTDPRFFERYWCVLHDNTGELMIALGGSFYPNLDRAEAYAIVTHRGKQRSVRAWRHLGADRTNLHTGPLRHEIVRGMREWRFVLAGNEWDIAFDLQWLDTKRQIYSAAYASLGARSAPQGRQRDVTAGFEGFGIAGGEVRVAGQTLRFEPGELRGTRDRHWGIGRGVGGPALQFGGPKKAGWIGGNWISFPHLSIWGNTVLYDYGDARAGMGKVRHVQRRWRFEPETHIFLEGESDYTLDTGEVKHVRFRHLGQQTAYMRCGMYGGTPDKQIHHGMEVPDGTVEGDCYDLTDPAVRTLLSGLNEHHCEIECDGHITTGILQPLEPDAYQACAEGKPGWSLL
ncbi:hypothetical protein ACAX43_13255 [Paraburkholderia sp. IW21]|uniref:hypothetical protein n=1 Tax=Paraburkholderia sp. IW21 TaxID=3242488 RepID=UPI003522ECDC